MSDNLYKNYVKDERNSQKNIWNSYDENNESDNSVSEEEDHHEDSPKGGKSKKKYSVISQAVREKFIKRVLSKEVTIKEAAKEFGLKFSTSKAILQTYKKEGRIGKKKNRERKTKVVNAVFIANINPNNSLLGSLPLGPLNELKNLNLPNVNDPKNFDQNLGKLSDQKFAKGASINGYNKVTQSIIKEFGNDFLRDFIEKNFSQSRPQTLNPTPEITSSIPSNTNFGATNLTGMKHFINFGTSNTNKPTTAFNAISNLGNTSVLMPQKISSINSDIQPIGGGLNIPSTNQSKFLNQNKADSFLTNQKRAFQTYERESMGDFGTRSDQINDISVKKFKSGEDLWDFDVDKSKKDLEDFIYKTHNIIKNNLNDL